MQAMSAWLVKTRRAPSRYSRDARVYGHTTTAMHKLNTRPPRVVPDDIAVISIRETLEAALMEYNAANAVMDLVLFDEVSVLLQKGAAS